MHYSPNAQVILVEGTELNVNNKVAELTNKLKSEGKKVCVMTTNKSLKVNAEMVQFMESGSEESISHLWSHYWD